MAGVFGLSLRPAEIKHLNYLPSSAIAQEKLNIEAEFERITAISESVLTVTDNRIHFAGDLYDVLLNLRSWNREIATDRGRELWGKRTITYFVFDPTTKDFAPSKFCAYVAIGTFIQPYSTVYPHLNKKTEMAIDVYVTLDGTDSRFDGRRARLHLTERLAMVSQAIAENTTIAKMFSSWLDCHLDSITVHPKGAIVLSPPSWFK